MITASLLLLCLLQGPPLADTTHADTTSADTTRADTVVARDTLSLPVAAAARWAPALRPPLAPTSWDRTWAPLDTPVVRRRHAVEYSDLYYTRLTVHRWASYTMLPLFAAEYSLGQNLMQDASPASWMQPAHSLAAGGVGVLFGLNTITGLWNLWDARQDPSGRTRRMVHSILMLAADAGFAATGALAPGDDGREFGRYSDYQHRVRLHRGVAIGSMAVSTVGWAMMLLWKE